jgi:hypothetical protein
MHNWIADLVFEEYWLDELIVHRWHVDGYEYEWFYYYA